MAVLGFTDAEGMIRYRQPWWGALFAIACWIAIAEPTLAYALDFVRHSINSKSLNAILVTGDVRVGDTERLLKYVRSLPSKKNTAVYLSSPGGDLYEGMKLGRMFNGRLRVKHPD